MPTNPRKEIDGVGGVRHWDEGLAPLPTTLISSVSGIKGGVVVAILCGGGRGIIGLWGGG